MSLLLQLGVENAPFAWPPQIEEFPNTCSPLPAFQEVFPLQPDITRYPLLKKNKILISMSFSRCRSLMHHRNQRTTSLG